MVEDLCLICSSDELSIHENQLVSFILLWAQENQVIDNFIDLYKRKDYKPKEKQGQKVSIRM